MRKTLLAITVILGVSSGYSQTSKFLRGPKLKDVKHSHIMNVKETKNSYDVVTNTTCSYTYPSGFVWTYSNAYFTSVDKETMKPIDEPYEIFNYSKIKGKYDLVFNSDLWVWEDKYVSAWLAIPSLDDYTTRDFVLQIAQRSKKSEKMDIVKVPIKDYLEDRDTLDTYHLLSDKANDRVYITIFFKRGKDQYRTEILTVNLESSIVQPLLTVNNTEKGWGKDFALWQNLGSDKILIAVDNLNEKTFKEETESDNADARDSVYYYVFNAKKKSFETLVFSGLKKDKKELRTGYSNGHFIFINGFRSGAKEFDVTVYNNATETLTKTVCKLPAIENLDEGWKDKKKFKWAKGSWAMDALRYDLEKNTVFFVLSRMDYYNPPNTKNSDTKDYFDGKNGVVHESNHVGVTITKEGIVEVGDEMQTETIYRDNDHAFLGKPLYKKEGAYFLYQEASENYVEGVWNGGQKYLDFYNLPTDKKRLKKANLVIRKIPAKSKGGDENPSIVLLNKDVKGMPLLRSAVVTEDGNILALGRTDKDFFWMKIMLD